MVFTPRVRRAGFAISIIGLCAIAYRMGASSDANSDFVSIDGLAVPTAVLNIGEVWETNAYHLDLPIENRSDSEIGIRDFEASCSCASIEPRRVAIGGHQTAHVSITLDLTRRSLDQIGLGSRPVSVEIHPLRGGGPCRSW